MKDGGTEGAEGRVQLYHELARSRAQLAALTRRLLQAQEAERRHIARELHDEAGQALTSLLVGVRALEEAKSMTEVRRGARQLREIGARLMHDLARLARGLHPSVLDDLGLEPALNRMAKEMEQGLSTHISVDFASLDGRRLPGHVEHTLYRIAQEACSNGVKSARASLIEITVSMANDVVTLKVQDDGVGFDVEAVAEEAAHSGHLGLVNMRERAALVGGTLTVTSGDTGTTIEAHVPIVVGGNSEGEYQGPDRRRPRAAS